MSKEPIMNLTRVLALLVLAVSVSTSRAQEGWLLFRGDAQRSGAASNKPAWDKPVAWKRPLLFDKLEGFPDVDPDHDVARLIQRQRADADPTILPGSIPIIVNDMCVYRNYRGLVTVAMRKLKIKDEETGTEAKYDPGDIVWKGIPHTLSVANMYERSKTKDLMPSIVETLEKQKQLHLLLANPMIGTPGSDGKVIYAIEDCVFPSVALMQPAGVKGFFKVVMEEGFKRVVMANELVAYDATTGKLLWDTESYTNAIKPNPGNTYFLGTPIVSNGKLFVVNENGSDLRLLTVNPDFRKWKPNKEGSPVFEPEKTLSLLKIPEAEQTLNSPLRRTQPLHIAQTGDLLICPTNVGVVFGVDPKKMEVRWQYRYRAKKAPAPILPQWQFASPIVGKDRIVFTAADSPDIHCIDFTGKKIWSAPGDEDLYLATVHDDSVVLVGESNCRALSLKDGVEKWKLNIGEPAGLGVKDGTTYYVPIRQDAGKKAPAIRAIDLVNGKIGHRLDVPNPYAVGNLILHRGMLVSQSVTHIAAFPLEAKAK
jgi:outer membrane protein assembly factor BamB